MLITSVIHYQIHEELHAPFMAPLDQLFHICDRTVFRGNVVVISDIISHVNLRRLIRGTEPNDIDTEVLDVVELRNDTGDITDTVIVGVLERARPDLIYGAFLPPGAMVLVAGCGHGLSSGQYMIS